MSFCKISQDRISRNWFADLSFFCGHHTQKGQLERWPCLVLLPPLGVEHLIPSALKAALWPWEEAENGHHGVDSTWYCLTFQKSGFYSPVEVGSLSHYWRRFYTSQVVVWEFWTINSIKNCKTQTKHSKLIATAKNWEPQHPREPSKPYGAYRNHRKHSNHRNHTNHRNHWNHRNHRNRRNHRNQRNHRNRRNHRNQRNHRKNTEKGTTGTTKTTATMGTIGTIETVGTKRTPLK